jgi:ATP-dependent helicase/nuclease subunit A
VTRDKKVIPFPGTRAGGPSGREPGEAAECAAAAPAPAEGPKPEAGSPKPTIALPDQSARDLIRFALDDTLVVEAAAGTGKTTELVARIVCLIATGRARIDEIVAVTFTEKAAGELKLRIREELENGTSLGSDPKDVPFSLSPGSDPRTLLDEALAHLEEAHVSTIHGFCADLLRERPVEAGVDPGFEVLTEPQAEQLFDRAFRDWFQQQLEAPSEGVRRALRRLPAAWSPYADEDDGPVERLWTAGKDLREWRDLRAPWRREPFDRDAEVRASARAVCAFADLTENPSWAKDPLYETTAHVRQLAAEWRRVEAEEHAAERDYDGWEAALVRFGTSFNRDIRTGRKSDYGRGATRAEVLAARDALVATLEDFTRRTEADLAALLQQDLLACVDLYDEMKTRAGTLDFLDLLLRARALVRDCAPVRRAFQERFEYILVDEFQDTDPLQAEILLLLAAEEDSQPAGYRLQASGYRPANARGVGQGFSPAESAAAACSAGAPAPAAGPQPVARSLKPDWRSLAVRRGALFVVGDPKQSIYRFRRADVGIYQEVCDLLVKENGARRVHLSTNFRTVPSIQRAINTAFAPEMTRDDESLQADYVPLAPWRRPIGLRQGDRLQATGDWPVGLEAEAGLQLEEALQRAADGLKPEEALQPEACCLQPEKALQPAAFSRQPESGSAPDQPAVIALPVPDPYGKRDVTMPSIEKSLPDAVGAWVHWLLTGSGWHVTERKDGQWLEVPVEARHVCILLRRFTKYGAEDVTRPYVDALEARGITHLLVGGRSFHDREEVETLRAALAAIEWPEDALSVYATLRGALFALGEETLLAYWHTHPRRRFHPFDVPDDLPSHLQPVGDALAFLRTLHARRNHRPAAETLGHLLEHTRAHVTFVMRPAGERVLANVLQVVELARQYEADGGISFRGFVDTLRDAADRSEAPEAPVVEEGSDGVRLMTVHKAKGLEFPVVILADMTCRLNRKDASRHIDQARGLCATQAGRLLAARPAGPRRPGDPPRGRRRYPPRLRCRHPRARRPRRPRDRRLRIRRLVRRPEPRGLPATGGPPHPAARPGLPPSGERHGAVSHGRQPRNQSEHRAPRSVSDGV